MLALRSVGLNFRPYQSFTYRSSSGIQVAPLGRTRSTIGSHTIYATATPIGIKSAIAIVRVEGPLALKTYQQLTTSTKSAEPLLESSTLNEDITPPPHGKAILRRVVCPETKETIDPEAIVLRFDHKQHSQTSTVEFHLHGSPAVVRALLSTLSRLDGLRPARAGEFTQRRFERIGGCERNIDRLLGLKSLIDSETEEQRKYALRRFDGNFKSTYQLLRNKLLNAMSLCEAIIDFSEDGQIEEQRVWQQVKVQVRELSETIMESLSELGRTEKVSNGIRISIFGKPNVGKSTFLNHLVDREASIVSPYPGTTRDIVEISMDFHGFPVIISDTAGIRTTSDPVEKIGVERAQKNISQADIRLHLVSISDLEDSLTAESVSKFNRFSSSDMILLTKSDLVPVSKVQELTQNCSKTIKKPVFPISVHNQSGISKFISELQAKLNLDYGSNRSDSTVTFANVYHKDCLLRISGHLKNFLNSLENDGTEETIDIVILIEELRLAAGLLGELSKGRTDEILNEEILGKIFQSFCIGK
ncbi:tRNA modification GTPase GTPBP3 [Phakopsora pachyrhizi]|nr:tRNA modification GTPase GTPBP3 [Phakopsora pachyrhizi]KAI8452037.1 tRNA modification GTPase GTPBP3 [Phakopsora pachyrhizi]